MILIRTPYSNNADYQVEDGVYFAQRGYAVAIQDVRGRFDSDGEWAPFVHEAEDGYDAQEWCGTQPWSTGKVGTSGASYLALTQWLAAPLRNRHLAAMAPRVGFSNLYHNWVYTGGAFQLGFNLRWGAVQMHTRTNQIQYLWMPPEQHYSTLFWHLPLLTGDERAGRVTEFYREWIRHPDYGPYWERLGNVEKDYARIDVPAYGFGGWYDVFLQGTLNNFMGVRGQGGSERARRQKVLIGPWIHSLGERGTESRTGDIDFGPESLVDLRREELRWFDYWLRGVDDGIMQRAAGEGLRHGRQPVAHRGGLAHPRHALRAPLLPLGRAAPPRSGATARSIGGSRARSRRTDTSTTRPIRCRRSAGAPAAARTSRRSAWGRATSGPPSGGRTSSSTRRRRSRRTSRSPARSRSCCGRRRPRRTPISPRSWSTSSRRGTR